MCNNKTHRLRQVCVKPWITNLDVLDDMGGSHCNIQHVIFCYINTINKIPSKNRIQQSNVHKHQIRNIFEYQEF